VQDVLRAVPAPGALVRTDKHVRGCRVEVPVAAFAIRPQLQHMSSIHRQRCREQAPVPGSTSVAAYVEASQTADLPFFRRSGLPVRLIRSKRGCMPVCAQGRGWPLLLLSSLLSISLGLARDTSGHVMLAVRTVNDHGGWPCGARVHAYCAVARSRSGDRSGLL